MTFAATVACTRCSGATVDHGRRDTPRLLYIVQTLFSDSNSNILSESVAHKIHDTAAVQLCRHCQVYSYIITNIQILTVTQIKIIAKVHVRQKYNAIKCMIVEELPDVTKYLFWSGTAAAAAASVCCRCVHEVAEFVEADG